LIQTRFVIASSNAGKIRELAAMLPPGMELIPQSDLGIADAVEDGQSFIENATIKARNACRYSGMPAMADDSGLEVDALGGAPGVYSARYAGSGATDADNVNKLLSAMIDVPDIERTARFRCVIALLWHAEDAEPVICEGAWEGRIQTRPSGVSGFGYDPVFFVPAHNCSAAELEPAEKNRLSHRAGALKELLNAISTSVDVGR
jgi:XTP/dITP diphosphohydrolase